MYSSELTAIEWMSKNIDGTHDLSQEILDGISGFALMWSLFEASELDGATNFTEEIPKIALRINDAIDSEKVNDILSFWVDRYVVEERTNSKFDYLINHTENVNSEAISTVLLGKSIKKTEKITCIIHIIYRLRNNLFHGNKNIMKLGNQTPNINHAICSLQILLKASGRFAFMAIETP